MNVFTRVTVKTLKKNRTRTIVTIIGIILATAMLTAVTTFISSLQNFMVESVILDSGSWHGALMDLPEEKVQEIAQAEEVKNSGAFQDLGFAVLSDAVRPEKSYLFVAGMSEELYDLLSVKLVQGRMPENSRELVISRGTMIQGGFSAEIGESVSLELSERYFEGRKRGIRETLVLAQDRETRVEELVPLEIRDYTVVGIIETPVFEGYSGPAYAALTAMDETPDPGSRYTCYFEMKKPSAIYDFITERQEEGLAETHSELLRYQGVSKNRSFMNMLYGLAAILIVLIMTGGISLVYNSFAISVSDRTRQFGLLTSMGATPRQLRGMVRKEALLVSAVGIPLGVLSGILGIGVTLKIVGRSFSYLYSEKAEGMELSVSMPAVLIAVLIALLTVLISAWIPARRASRTSPMEAIRQNRDIQVPKNVKKSGHLSYRLFGLPGMIAGKHFARSKRQYRATIFSLFISIVLFISASSFSAYVRSSVVEVNETPDYDVAVYLDWNGLEEQENERLQREIEGVSGMSRCLKVRETYVTMELDENLINEEYRQFLSFREEETGEEREAGRVQVDGRLLLLSDQDYEDYLKDQGLWDDSSGQQPQVVVMNQMEAYFPSQERYRICQILKQADIQVETLFMDYTAWEAAGRGEDLEGRAYEELYQSCQRSVDLTVDALTDAAPLNMGANYGGFFGIVMAESTLEGKLGSFEDFRLQSRMFVQAKEHKKVADDIENLVRLAGKELEVYVTDLTESLQVQKNMLFTVDVFTYGFITLISLIAAANVFNTISTGILLRRREFAVLTSVGLGPKGLKRMLNYECLLYGTKSLLYGIPVSVLVTWCIFHVVSESMDTGFFIPLFSILIAVCSVFAVVFATMLYARARLEKENIMDGIRQESV
ncbi:MAG: ABC transporter permease [Lachnospiraceae bacterium]|nr:ABC transporter permease [Lachnospiraceae bacterium]